MNLPTICAPFLLIPLGLIAGSASHSGQSAASGPKHVAASAQPSSGERVFAANCSRCHEAPMSLSPRITRTVIMHMRVRARLSSEDERAVLKYLAP
jgi:hypothetical protein